MKRLSLGVVSALLLCALWWAVLSLPAQPAGLTGLALEKLSGSGVTNPVTAVLLNYRGYDTLLEIAVLLLAILGVWSVRRGPWPVSDLRGRPLLLSFLRISLPVLVLAAGYLLWIGSSAPGGAFQGGALLGGGIVLLSLGGVLPSVYRPGLPRLGLVLGVLVFASSAAATIPFTGGLLEYPAGAAGMWILVIECAALVSIGATLGLLYLGGRPRQEDSDLREDAAE
jgi:multisubunit Na+/H+ antiporter MnhB subunit